MQVKVPTGISPVTSFRLLPRAPRSRSASSSARSAGDAPGSGSPARPIRYWPVRLFGLAMMSAGVPSATTWPPCTPAAGPMSITWSAVRIASSSCSTTSTELPRSRRPFRRGQQPRVVALVQADRRLVQHIEHAGQARADLAGQPDALALAARQRARAARQVQVLEPDVDQEAQAVVDLLQDPPGDLHLLVGELALQRGEPVAGRADGQRRDLGDVLAGDLHRQRLGLQPGAAADLARRLRLVAAEFLAHPARSRSRASAAPGWAARPRRSC